MNQDTLPYRSIGFPVLNGTAPKTAPSASPSERGSQPASQPAGMPEQGTPKTTIASPSTSPLPSPTATGRAVTSRPATGGPTAKRPKGQLFISSVIVSIIVVTAWTVWREFLRYQAYGIVNGRVVDVAAPWTGLVRQLYVREGQYVHPGELLAILDNSELNLRLGKLRSELELAQATVTSRIAELHASEREIAESVLRLQVDYFQLLSDYQQQRSRLDELKAAHQRLEQLSQHQAVAQAEVEAAGFELEGQSARVAELSTAVERMKEGLAAASTATDQQPILELEQTRLAALRTQWEDLCKHQALGEIRAPVAGKIVNCQRLAGERVAETETVLELLEAGSLQTTFYLPEEQARHFPPGTLTHVQLPSHRKPIQVQVIRYGTQLVPPPPNLVRHYRVGIRLVEIVAVPLATGATPDQAELPLWLDAEVRLPRFARRTYRSPLTKD